jgi:GAF domain-containing protein
MKYMDINSDKRLKYRRYEDRRVAMMLSIYEIIFEEQNNTKRRRKILSAIADNFQVEKASLIELLEIENEICGCIEESFGNWKNSEKEEILHGLGFKRLLELHELVDGALSFESVRKSDAFEDNEWKDFWNECADENSRAFLSVMINSQKRKLLWLQNVASTREWSSRDRELIEEVAFLLTKVERKEFSNSF